MAPLGSEAVLASAATSATALARSLLPSSAVGAPVPTTDLVALLLAVGASVLPSSASSAVDASMPALASETALASAAFSAIALAFSLLFLALRAPLLSPPASLL